MATFTKRGDSWYVRVRIKGISRAGSFPTKGKAQAWATQTEADILAGKAEQAPSTKTLAEAFDRYAEVISPTKRGSRWEIIRLNKFKSLPFASHKIGEVTTPTLAEWRDEQLKTLKSSSVNREMNLLASVFEIARREWKWIEINPIRDVTRPAQPRHRERLYNTDEITKITNQLGYTKAKPETKQQIIAAAFLFALETAMRREEITTLTWDRVSLNDRFITLPMTKNGEARDVPLTTKAVEILKKMQHLETPFPVDKDVLSTLFRRACNDTGIKDAHFHDSRANAITALSQQLDILELARAIGHRDVRSLQIYYRKTAADIAKKLR